MDVAIDLLVAFRHAVAAPMLMEGERIARMAIGRALEVAASTGLPPDSKYFDIVTIFVLAIGGGVVVSLLSVAALWYVTNVARRLQGCLLTVW
jgi:hypothetical protein